MGNLPETINSLDLVINGKSNRYDKVSKDKYTLEEALGECGSGKYHWFIFLTSGFTLASVIVEGMFAGFVVPLAKCELPLTIGEQGFLNSTAYLGIVLGSYLWGFLADVKGRRACLRIELLGGFAFSFLSAFSANPWMLIISRLLVGICVAGNQATPMAYLGEFYVDSIRTNRLSKVAMFLPGGVIYLPLLGWIFTPMEWRIAMGAYIFAPWRVMAIMLSMVGLLAFIMINFCPESPKFLLTAGRHDEAIEVLETLYHRNTGQPKENYPCRHVYLEEENPEPMTMSFRLLWNRTKPLFVMPYVKSTLECALLMACLFSIAHGAFLWLPEIISSLSNRIDEAVTVCQGINLPPIVPEIIEPTVNTTTTDCVLNANPISQIIILVASVLFAIIYYFIGDIINCIGVKKLMYGWISGVVVAAIALIFINNFYAITVVLLAFVSVGNVAGILSAIAVDLFPTKVRGMAMCIIMMAGRLGAICGSNLSGALLYTPLCYLNFIIFTVFAVLCILVVFLLPRTVK